MTAITGFADRVRLDGWQATSGRLAKRTGFYVLIALFVLASLFPFYWIAITSLKTSADLSKGTTGLLPGHISFGSYKFDITQTSATGINFGRALLNSLLIAASTAILGFILAWNDFTFALSYMTSPGMYTAPLAIVDLGHTQYQTFYNRIDAAVVPPGLSGPGRSDGHGQRLAHLVGFWGA